MKKKRYASEAPLRGKNSLPSATRFVSIAGKQFRRVLMAVGCVAAELMLVQPAVGNTDGLADFAPTGSDDAMVALAQHFIDLSKDSMIAVAILRDLAAKGNTVAIGLLGSINLDLNTDPQKNAEALKQLEQAAGQHDADAATILTFYFLNAKKSDHDFTKARQFAQEAADLGRKEGYYALGLIEAYGCGVTRDSVSAVQEMKKAADLGDTYAMKQLALYYHEGFGVQRNDLAAYTWATLVMSRDKANSDGAKLQDGLALLLLPDEIIEGQHMAASWKPGEDFAQQQNVDHYTAAQLSPGDSPIVSAPGPIFAAERKRTKIDNISIAERLMTVDLVVKPDETVIDTSHMEYEARNEAALKDLGQIPVSFDNAIEQLDIVEAYTQKADGRKIYVDPKAILTQQASDAQDNLMFDDRRRKVIIFPNVEVGDVVSYTWRRTRKALIPGLFSAAFNFDPTGHAADERYRITVPKSLPLFVEAHGVGVNRSVQNDNFVYQLNYANRRPLDDYQADFDSYDVYPRVMFSNLRDYRQFVDAYQPLVESKVVVTPQVRQLADKLTAGISDRRAQAEAIYNWVSRHIRYVGVEFGVGGVVPHNADNILTNGYGDCKDHSLVFAALLKAKGIKADLVLINGGWQMSLSVPPRIQNFDHMITYLPEFNLYTDTTAEVAPFGTLPFSEYGKPVVVVPLDEPDGAVVRRVPVLKPGAATMTMKTTAHLQSDGKIVGDSETIGTGPFGVDLRDDAEDLQSGNQTETATKWLKDDGYDGTGSFDFKPPQDLGPSYRIAGHFETEAYGGLLKGSQFEMPRGLLDSGPPGGGLMGPISFKGEGDDPTYCWSGQQVEELSLELPAGVHLMKLPTGMKVKTDHMAYNSTWSMAGQTITLRREFVSTIDVPVCLGWTRTDMAKALRQIKSDRNTSIELKSD